MDFRQEKELMVLIALYCWNVLCLLARQGNQVKLNAMTDNQTLSMTTTETTKSNSIVDSSRGCQTIEFELQNKSWNVSNKLIMTKVSQN